MYSKCYLIQVHQHHFTPTDISVVWRHLKIMIITKSKAHCMPCFSALCPDGGRGDFVFWQIVVWVNLYLCVWVAQPGFIIMLHYVCPHFHPNYRHILHCNQHLNFPCSQPVSQRKSKVYWLTGLDWLGMAFPSTVTRPSSQHCLRHLKKKKKEHTGLSQCVRQWKYNPSKPLFYFSIGFKKAVQFSIKKQLSAKVTQTKVK